jgi:nucleoid DNA-binding protein
LSITKKDIAKKMSLKISESDKSCNDLVTTFLNIIKTQSLAHDIKIANFGTFINKVTPKRMGRNPKTGQVHTITERVKLNFIVSNKVKKELN